MKEYMDRIIFSLTEAQEELVVRVSTELRHITESIVLTQSQYSAGKNGNYLAHISARICILQKWLLSLCW